MNPKHNIRSITNSVSALFLIVTKISKFIFHENYKHFLVYFFLLYEGDITLYKIKTNILLKYIHVVYALFYMDKS